MPEGQGGEPGVPDTLSRPPGAHLKSLSRDAIFSKIRLSMTDDMAALQLDLQGKASMAAAIGRYACRRRHRG